MDPWRSPKWVGDAHLADQSAYFQRNWWPTTTRSRLPAPVQTETRTVPSDYGPGPNNRKRIKNAREEAIETNDTNRSMAPKVCFLGAVRRRTMICCRYNLCLERCPRPKQIDNRPDNEPEKISHYRSASPDSRSAASQ